MKHNINLVASSLANAVFLCVLISVFCGCIVLISHYQNLLNAKIEFRETLLNINNATFTYYKDNINLLQYSDTQQTDVLDEEITSSVTRKKWGCYDVLTAQTIFKDDTIVKSAMVGSRNRNAKLPTLFLTNYNIPLKVSGETTLVGKLEVPEGQIEESYINGRKGNNVTISRDKIISKKQLPKISISPDVDFTNIEKKYMSQFTDENFVFNPFTAETLYINASEINNLGAMVFKGNIVIYSNNNLNINQSTQLFDVIVSANTLTIDANFTGTAHIVAKKSVTIEKNVELKYPSSIYLKSNQDSTKVHIKENAKIAGGIIIDGLNFPINSRQLIIDSSAEVYGSVYCNGQTQLQGSVYGNLYTNRFFLKTQSSKYENTLLNATINSEKLPENFVQLPLFKINYEESTQQIVKWL